MKTAKLLALGLLLMAAVYAKPLLLIIDASGSMEDTLPSGETKIATAKSVATETINSYNDQIALMVYDDCDSGGDPMSGSIIVSNAFTTDKSALTSKVSEITANSDTPLANSITEGVLYAKQNGGGAQIVILTDGLETCDGDISGAIQSAEQQGINVKLVGFALSEEDKQNISSAVTSAGGSYYDAGDELGLQQAFTQAIQTATPTSGGSTYDPYGSSASDSSCASFMGILGLVFAGAYICRR